MTMAIDQVREYLRAFDADNRIREFDTSSATVELAAAALGCEPARIAKTISLGIGERCILVVAAGDARIDNQKYRSRFDAKATMLRPEAVLRQVGHAVGGVCPFAVNPEAEIYIDESLYRFTTVFPACGSSNSVIELTLPELEAFSHFQGRVDVCKGWTEAGA